MSDAAIPPYRTLRPGQRTCVWVAGVDGGEPELVHETAELLLEAPNWSPDGMALLLNGNGLLWRLELGSGDLAEVRIENLPPINNDHVIDTERGLVYLSASDGQIHVAPLAGGPARRVTTEVTRSHYLHGVSPDGLTLAFVDLPSGQRGVPGRLALVPAAGGATRYPAAGRGHLDGPEFSADGAWLYVNTENWATRPGHAQLARVPAEGGELERLLSSDTVDWFPHLSPDGAWATYVSFPAGTLGHPADLDVEVRLVRTDDWTRPVARHPLFGGQGTLNVNSWAPDSHRYAFVSYPVGQGPALAPESRGLPGTERL